MNPVGVSSFLLLQYFNSRIPCSKYNFTSQASNSKYASIDSTMINNRSWVSEHSHMILPHVDITRKDLYITVQQTKSTVYVQIYT